MAREISWLTLQPLVPVVFVDEDIVYLEVSMLARKWLVSYLLFLL